MRFVDWMGCIICLNCRVFKPLCIKSWMGYPERFSIPNVSGRVLSCHPEPVEGMSAKRNIQKHSLLQCTMGGF